MRSSGVCEFHIISSQEYKIDDGHEDALYDPEYFYSKVGIRGLEILKSRNADLQRGDLILFECIAYENNYGTCIFDGNQLSLLNSNDDMKDDIYSNFKKQSQSQHETPEQKQWSFVHDCYPDSNGEYIPPNFEVIHEFPLNYWSEHITHNTNVWVNISSYVDEILKNVKIHVNCYYCNDDYIGIHVDGMQVSKSWIRDANTIIASEFEAKDNKKYIIIYRGNINDFNKHIDMRRLNLPSLFNLSDEDTEYICDKIGCYINLSNILYMPSI